MNKVISKEEAKRVKDGFQVIMFKMFGCSVSDLSLSLSDRIHEDLSFRT